MDNIINMIEEKYVLDGQKIKRLENGKIQFIDEHNETIETQTKRQFINDYIDFLTDLLNDNRESNENTTCVYILEDLIILYRGLEMLDLINK